MDSGYPQIIHRTLNCEGVVPSHIKGDETAIGYPLRTYTMCTSHRRPQLCYVMCLYDVVALYC